MDLNWRDIADIVGVAIMGLLTIVWRNLNGEIKAAKSIAEAALPNAQFMAYVERTEAARKEFRESIVKLFERTEAHERRDEEAFKMVTRDFTAGMNALRDTIWQGQREILKELNNKADKHGP